MLGLKTPPRKRSRDPAEKPFWISFSDLMTALMVLFLVAMAVALMAVTQGLQRLEVEKLAREQSIQACLGEVRQLAAEPRFRGLRVLDNVIEFGTAAEFERRGHALGAERSDLLRRFVAPLLERVRGPSCQRWLKRVVVEGYASAEGSYLFNLNLSLQRSQRVLCALLDGRGAEALSQADRRFLRSLFLVGGASFNAQKRKPEESRRFEFRLEFRELGERAAPNPELPWDEDAACPLDAGQRGAGRELR